MHAPFAHPATPAAQSTDMPAAAAELAPAADDELSDDDLEQVVGGLARTWTDALRAARRSV